MKILLLDGSQVNTLGILRHLKKHTVDIVYHKSCAAKYSRYCNKLVIAPKASNEKEFVEFLLDHLNNNSYDFLMPVSALSSYICSKYAKELKEHVRVEIADFENFKIAINKTETYKFCEKHGILHPKTFSKIEDVTYPLIIKSTWEIGGKFPVKYVYNEEEFKKELAIIGEPFENLIVQECIEGEPYGFFCLYQNGKIKRALGQRRIREFPPSGGHATSAETVFDKDLIQVGKSIYDKLNWNGVGMVEFKKKDGKYYVIELNPKFWTAIELHIVAGMHFPEDLLQDNLEYSDSYKKQSFVWLFAHEGELYRFRNLLKVIRDVFRSKTDLHLDDIKPTIMLFLYWIAWVLGIGRKKKRA